MSSLTVLTERAQPQDNRYNPCPSQRRWKGIFRQRIRHAFAASDPQRTGPVTTARQGANVPMPAPEIEFLQVGTASDARAIAVQASPGDAPGIFWLSGF